MIHLFDPGCVAATGHHPAINRAFLHALGREHLTPYYHQSCPMEVVSEIGGGRTCLKGFVVYGRDPRADVVAEQQWQADALLEDLRVVDFADGDRIVMHTCTAGHLLALSSFLKDTDVDLTASALLRFPASHRATLEQSRDMRELYDTALRLLCGRVTFLADSQQLAGYFEEMLSGLRLRVAPIPVDWNCEIDSPPADLTFGYLGEAREEKGFGHLTNALQGVLSRLKVRFRIQAPGAKGMPTFGGRVEWLNRASLDTREYYELIHSISAVIAAYDPRHYDLRTSQTFIEALGFGKPVLTTRGTWMAYEMQQLEELPGVIIDGFSPAAIVAGVEQMVAQWDQISRAAKVAAPRIRQRHNIQNFVRAFIN